MAEPQQVFIANATLKHTIGHFKLLIFLNVALLFGNHGLGQSNGASPAGGQANLPGIRSANLFPGADMGAKINAAIADFGTAQYGPFAAGPASGGIVFVPSGEWTISTPVRLTSGIRLMGAGRMQTVLRAADGLNHSVILVGVNAAETGTAPAAMFSGIYNLTVDGNAIHQTATSHGIHLGSFARLEIRSIRIENTRNDCIRADNGAGTGVTGGSGVLILDDISLLAPMEGSAPPHSSNGIYLWGVSDSILTDVDFNGLNGTPSANGIWLRDCGDLHLSHNMITGAGNPSDPGCGLPKSVCGTGVLIEHSQKIVLADNMIDAAKNHGIWIGDSGNGFNSGNVTLIANHVLSTFGPGSGIFISGLVDGYFIGNIADRSGSQNPPPQQTYGLSILNDNGISNLVAIGNKFTGNSQGEIFDPGGKITSLWASDSFKLGGARAHLETGVSSSDVAGTVSISDGIEATKIFARPFKSQPTCTLTPTSSPNGLSWWVSTSASSLTAHLSAAGTLSFNYSCFGNPD
jgi:hypothetical protein